MYIAPNTNIKILKNCPLDESFNHTIYFNNAEEQRDYFSSLCPSGRYNLTKQSYQRVRKGAMRVEIKAEDLYDCNYLMFQNESFGNKWFYAFITSVEYVNNITSEITFMIDPMQTWFFDYTLKESFVEREHSATDVVGDNTIPESVDLGSDYLFLNTHTCGLYNDEHVYVIIATFYASERFIDGHSVWTWKPTEDGRDTDCRTINGVLNGLYYTICKTPDDVNRFVETANVDLKSDGIIAIFDVPRKMVENSEGTLGLWSGVTRHIIHSPKRQTRLGTYTPRNKKLLTAPYNQLYVTDKQGRSVAFPYEFFDDDSDTCDFSLSLCMSNTPSAVIMPIHYLSNGSAQETYGNTDQMMSLTGWQPSSYSTDYYKAWWSQNGTALGINLMSDVVNLGTASAFGYGVPSPLSLQNGKGFLAGTPIEKGGGISGEHNLAPVVGGVTNLITDVASTMNQVRIARMQPPQAHGNGGVSIIQGMELLDFLFGQKCIRPEYARIIDDYFDMFGYATHRKKVPNRNVRPHWTYTKTIGCVITGNISSDDRSMICSIYDKGITFWKNGSEVGNYSLDNRV